MTRGLQYRHGEVGRGAIHTPPSTHTRASSQMRVLTNFDMCDMYEQTDGRADNVSYKVDSPRLTMYESHDW